ARRCVDMQAPVLAQEFRPVRDFRNGAVWHLLRIHVGMPGYVEQTPGIAGGFAGQAVGRIERGDTVDVEIITEGARAQGRQRNAPYTVGIATEVCARTRGKAGNVAATGQAHCLGLRRAQAKDDVAVVEELGRSYRWRAAELCQGGAGGKAQ